MRVQVPSVDLSPDNSLGEEILVCVLLSHFDCAQVPNELQGVRMTSLCDIHLNADSMSASQLAQHNTLPVCCSHSWRAKPSWANRASARFWKSTKCCMTMPGFK